MSTSHVGRSPSGGRAPPRAKPHYPGTLEGAGLAIRSHGKNVGNPLTQ